LGGEEECGRGGEAVEWYRVAVIMDKVRVAR
jgi:hypothetical protein